ncbi:MAG TPA: EAL domain-containing protein [Desulfomonilaceae bacterium]|nr:EAL domain-containing protein [Desulfomonilaceae bacterium]
MPLVQGNSGSEARDFRSLKGMDATGSFYLNSMEASFLGKLLNALPIPALLVDKAHTIVFANHACGGPEGSAQEFHGKPFSELFPHTGQALAVGVFIDAVLKYRKPKVTTTLLQLAGAKIWGRMHFRSMRGLQGRSALILVENLTHEKKQLLLTKKHKEELKIAHEQLERRVEERTVELRSANIRLQREVLERKRAENELDVSRASFTSIVEKSRDGIIVVGMGGEIHYSNPAAKAFLGSSGAHLASTILELASDHARTAEIPILSVGGSRGTAEMHVINTDWHGSSACLAMIREITERKVAEKALRESEHRYRQMFQGMRAVKMVIDPETGQIVDANSAAARFYEYPLEDLKCMNFTDISAQPPDEVFETVSRAMSETENYFLVPHRISSGEIREIEIYTGPIQLHERTFLNCIIHDVTDRRRAEEKLNLAAKIIENSNEAIVTTNTEGFIVNVNQAFSKITGYAKEEAVGHDAKLFQCGRDELNPEMWQLVQTTGQWQGEVWDRRKSGEVYPKLLSVSTVKNNENAITHYVTIFSDITELKKAEKYLRQLAHFDPLTKLPNRLLFQDRLQRALIEADRRKCMVTLMLLDLDRFKNINDTLGHSAGDDLLIAVAQRLTRCVRKSDTVARLGGDEFTVVLPEIPSNMAAANVARKIIEAMSEPFDLAGREVFITTSIGVTLYPSDANQADRLLQNADMALYHAKEQGKNNFQFFNEGMNVEAIERSELEDALRGAVERNEFLVHYQPRLNFRSEEINTVEALVRWNHPKRGLILPGQFIAAAEETGTILPMGEWVLRTACQQNQEWQEMGLPPVRVAVNVSARQLISPQFPETILRTLDETGLDPNYLELELTESVAMNEADTTIRVLSDLKNHGIRISIDDFGTGYSSLSYLKQFPIDKLKIDKSFVKDIPSDSDDEAIVTAIIAVAHSLKLKVVAEGVETLEQLSFLRSHGCDEWQGYWFSPPVPAEGITRLLRSRSSSMVA